MPNGERCFLLFTSRIECVTVVIRGLFMIPAPFTTDGKYTGDLKKSDDDISRWTEKAPSTFSWRDFLYGLFLLIYYIYHKNSLLVQWSQVAIQIAMSEGGFNNRIGRYSISKDVTKHQNDPEKFPSFYLVRSDNHYIEHDKDSREWDVLESLWRLP